MGGRRRGVMSERETAKLTQHSGVPQYVLLCWPYFNDV